MNPQQQMSDSIQDAILDRLQDASSNKQKMEGESVTDAQIAAVYAKVALMMSRYRSGKIPKAFKIIPRLQNWEEVLLMTKPEGWTPNATYQATRVFMSALTPRMAEIFVAEVLLPKIREDVANNRKLNSHLYESLKKALYKPAAFFKGIVLALCQADEAGNGGDVTLKEATIIASIVARMSVPVLHSAATLLKLSQMGYSGVRSIFIKTLLEKRYALPERVVHAMVDYFLRFTDFNSQEQGDIEEDHLPVLWHQSLLIFVQRYKHQIDADQIAKLRILIQRQFHSQISPEVLRELDQAGIMQA